MLLNYLAVHHLRAEDQQSDQSFGTSVDAIVDTDTDKECFDKVEMVEVIEFGATVECDLSYATQCFTTYVTNYESQQEEECRQNYRKNCFIQFEQMTVSQTVTVRRTPLVRDCHEEGPETCRMESEVECRTEQDVQENVTECKEGNEMCKLPNNLKKYVPVTICIRQPIKLCDPAGCGYKEGVAVCYNKTQTEVKEIPKEECYLDVESRCKDVNKFVIKLSPTEQCLNVPREIFNNTKKGSSTCCQETVLYKF